jgi:acyl carrier protein
MYVMNSSIDGNEEPRETLSGAEGTLLEIVRELLKNDRVGPEDDFFLAGGHSLLGTQLVMRSRKAFGVKVSLRDLFQTGTVAKLAVRVEELLMEELNAMSDDEIARMARTKG